MYVLDAFHQDTCKVFANCLRMHKSDRSKIAHIFEILLLKYLTVDFTPKNHLESINVAVMIACLSKTKRKEE